MTSILRDCTGGKPSTSEMSSEQDLKVIYITHSLDLELITESVDICYSNSMGTETSQKKRKRKERVSR